MSFSEQDFLERIRQNDTNRRLLGLLPALDLPQATLTAGCLFQTIWNIEAGHEPDRAIRDYDVFYFDDDLSWEAEDAVIRKAKESLGDLAGKVEIRNQARVHLWYPEKFGAPCPPLTRVEDGIDRFLIACTVLGVRIGTNEVYAPNGFGDMWKGVLRINPNNPQPGPFRAKCQDYKARWPWLSVAQ